MPPLSAPHRIRRQRLDVRAPDQGTAFALRTQLRRDVDDVLLPALERAFDAAGVGDEVIRIPRLEVRLRVRNAGELADSLDSELPALIAEQLEAVLSGIARATTATARRETVVVQRRTSLLHYLATGQLDWPDMQGDSGAQAASLREEAISLAELWRAAPTVLRNALPTQFEALRAFFFRFLQLLPDTTGQSWIAAIIESVIACAPASLTPQLHWMQALRALVASPASVGYGALRAQADVLALAFTPALPSAEALLAAVHALPGMHAIGIDLVQRVLRGEIAPVELPKLLASSASAAKSETAGSRAADAPVTPVTHDAPETMASTQGEAVQADEYAADDLPPAVLAAAAPPLAEEAAVLRVQVAGLVLAHPFLSSLFAARGLLDADGKTLPREHMPRAAALLHWLACGRDEVFEFELGLIKPLLGLRPDDHLPVSQGLLDDADREECTALLEAMISHWPALRSTSIEGLRVSFLQRQGLLRDSDNGLQAGWQLQPESESFDMLLAQLPWSISIVRLPWMTRPIFTDWPTR